MAVYFSSLNSGSNGNCYYVGNDQEAILVDVGISCRETEKRLQRSGLSAHKIKAIFISHEHGDHIAGVSVLSKKFRLPVYITPATLANARLSLDAALVKTFQPHQPVTIGGLTITGFPKLHDAIDPHSFVVESEGITVGIFTDIGRACVQVKKYFRQCHAVFMEANYDTDMLENGGYPLHLKNRIRGGLGHLSNKEALELYQQHKAPFLQQVLLSHLSKNNNSHEKALGYFQHPGPGAPITIASRYNESPVYQVTEAANVARTITPIPRSKKKKGENQLSLF